MAETDTRQWPELQDELSRKALDVVHQAAFKLQNGEISEREMWLIADAVYDTITGLARWEEANIVYAIRQEMKKDG